MVTELKNVGWVLMSNSLSPAQRDAYCMKRANYLRWDGICPIKLPKNAIEQIDSVSLSACITCDKA